MAAHVERPKTVQVSKPYEQQPMWHNHNGGLVITTNSPGLRIEGQDWSELTLEAFPSASAEEVVTQRTVHALKTAAKTGISMKTDGTGKMKLSISAADDGVTRAWALRVHLRVGQKVESAAVDGNTLQTTDVVHIAPRATNAGAYSETDFIFNAVDTPPPLLAGDVALIRIAGSAKPHEIELKIV